ncbi:PWWP domain-containing DNA repair factor 3A-like isoform X1 [Melanotaenia boesemani]|uniref:PWWP domain-containing DNA repair factor 3A-like isoform X1 n=1 Tax=Melanotaenia boesemani TaxID=1250792 RepID=UPI001C0492E0|nr:PWWP domain-containing DNA repair factor 3A-like isoform X1 [Melanotaenia boesemani]
MENPQHTDPEIDHMYCKRPYSFPSREQVQDNNDSSDQRQDVFTTTRDAGILSEDMSFNRLVERAQQAEQKRILASELLLTFITQDECLRQHLQAVIAGKLTPSWASKGRVRIFLEKEDQLDRVMSFLASLLEAQGTKCHDQVAFVMDVLLPEATLHAIAGVHAVSLHRATEIYECGLQYDYSEKQLFAHYASKNMSKEAEQKMLTYKEQLQRALESKDFVQML